MELCTACEKGNYEGVVQYLSRGRGNVNDLVGIHQVRRTALHHAAEYGHLKIIKVLVAVSDFFGLIS